MCLHDTDGGDKIYKRKREKRCKVHVCTGVNCCVIFETSIIFRGKSFHRYGPIILSDFFLLFISLGGRNNMVITHPTPQITSKTKN